MQEITSLAQFSALKSKPLLIIDFYADWCGPCKAISPIFNRLAEKHKGSTSVVFAKVNVDVARDVSSQCGITAMPTFQFWSNGTKKDEIRGADPAGLTRKIESLVASAKPSTTGTKLGGETKTFQAAAPVSSVAGGNLRSLIDFDASHALNASTTSSIKSILKPSFAGTTLDSFNGSALLLHIPLTAPINLKSIKISIPTQHAGSAPSKIHVGTNISPVPKDLMALARAETVQSFSVYSDEYTNGVTELAMKQAKFKNVTSVTVLIDANVTAQDTTRLSQIELLGSKA